MGPPDQRQLVLACLLFKGRTTWIFLLFMYKICSFAKKKYIILAWITQLRTFFCLKLNENLTTTGGDDVETLSRLRKFGFNYQREPVSSLGSIWILNFLSRLSLTLSGSRCNGDKRGADVSSRGSTDLDEEVDPEQTRVVRNKSREHLQWIFLGGGGASGC